MASLQAASTIWATGCVASLQPTKTRGQMLMASASHVARHSRHVSQSGRRNPAVAMAVSTAPDSTESVANTGGDLITWMKSHGMPECKVVLKDRLGGSEGDEPMHYVAAAVDLQPGDQALFVPNNLIVTLQRVLGDETLAELLTTNKLSELACLALYLCYEKKQGKSSFWLPFIQELDRQRARGSSAAESPLLWEPEEVEYFKGSAMKKEIDTRLAGIKKEYGELDTVWFMAGSLFKQYPFDSPTEVFSLDIFKQAFIAVQACVVHLQGVSLARRFALVPLGPPLLSYKSTCRAMITAAEGGVEMKVDRAVKAGEPLFVWCGPQTNTRMLLNYGTVDEDNPYDRLTVKIALNPSDPLYQDKRAIVQRNDKLTIQDYQLYRGKEAEAVNDMLPYLRLAHVNDPLDLPSVSFAQGPICTTNSCVERAVLLQLQSYFQARLAAYPTTIAEDDAIIADENASPRRRVAARLVRIEKQILTNALRAVDELIGPVPEVIDSPCFGNYQPTLS